ncbi:MAG: carbamoyltransferase [Anaerolineales bacterium]|nr:carbamoyltransferase [Anaerolineales bacterium]
MIILGLNAYHGDASACLLKDGKIVAAAEEERFLRVKHWAGFPALAIRYCLEEGKIPLSDVHVIALNRDPSANVFRKVLFSVARRPGFSFIRDRLKNAARTGKIDADFRSTFPDEMKRFHGEFRNVQHHIAHLSSAFHLSGYPEAAVCSVDGFGDFVSLMTAVGMGAELQVLDQVYFPHSLGLFYLAFSQYLGFPNYGDEYKVMGLSGYGKPTYLEKMREVILTDGGGAFRLDLNYFIHHSEGVAMTWEGGEPKMGNVFSDEIENVFGPARLADEPISQRHKDIASSLQARYEECFFEILKVLYARTGQTCLALAGGCAMNSLANGMIFDRSPFREVFIQPAAGDAGGALGAALAIYHEDADHVRLPRLERADLGPGYTDSYIADLLARTPALAVASSRFRVRVLPEHDLIRELASRIEDGLVAGFFQGRMEWGPRALGNRSIVVDPRRNDMKEILNEKIKRRESFRPFAPSILREAVADYFETDAEVPFMQQVFRIRPEKREVIPAVTHVDGTGRLQTVTEAQNPLYYRLIKEFGQKTGVPIILNTSFNENEPIVNRPEEALDCFLRTRMDVLALGTTLIERT